MPPKYILYNQETKPLNTLKSLEAMETVSMIKREKDMSTGQEVEHAIQNDYTNFMALKEALVGWKIVNVWQDNDEGILIGLSQTHYQERDNPHETIPRKTIRIVGDEGTIEIAFDNTEEGIFVVQEPARLQKIVTRREFVK